MRNLSWSTRTRGPWTWLGMAPAHLLLELPWSSSCALWTQQTAAWQDLFSLSVSKAGFAHCFPPSLWRSLTLRLWTSGAWLALAPSLAVDFLPPNTSLNAPFLSHLRQLTLASVHHQSGCRGCFSLPLTWMLRHREPSPSRSGVFINFMIVILVTTVFK